MSLITKRNIEVEKDQGKSMTDEVNMELLALALS